MSHSTYTAYTVTGTKGRVIHLWVGTGNLCGSPASNIPTLKELKEYAVCTRCTRRQAEFEAAQAAAQQEAHRIANTAPARRLTRGQAAVIGWEVLYDKPAQGAQVGRRDGKYALLCVEHKHVHTLKRLVDERAVRKAGNWCPKCDH